MITVGCTLTAQDLRKGYEHVLGKLVAAGFRFSLTRGLDGPEIDARRLPKFDGHWVKIVSCIDGRYLAAGT